MTITSRRTLLLPLLALMTVFGLSLAFTSPAEAHWKGHRSYKAEFNCPQHGPRCGKDFRARYSRKVGKEISCSYYRNHYRVRHHR